MKDVLEEDFDKITKRDISWDALRNSSFVITGATGLIGSLIVKSNHEFWCKHLCSST